MEKYTYMRMCEYVGMEGGEMKETGMEREGEWKGKGMEREGKGRERERKGNGRGRK
jgi:hypothetical protein